MMPTMKQLPRRCPFCWETSETEWREFRVRTFTERYYDADTRNFSAPRDEGFDLFCSRCGEHIRPEDIKEGDMGKRMCSCCEAQEAMDGDDMCGLCDKLRLDAWLDQDKDDEVRE